MRFSRNKSADSGFSLIELMVVTAIILVVSAMALPNIINSVQIMRMRSALTEVSGLYQQARRQAVRDAKTYPVLTTTAQGRLTFYIDLGNDGGYNAGEPTVALPDGVTIVSTPSDTTGIDTTTTVTGTLPAFNNRGLPCTYASQFACPFIATVAGNSVPSHFVIYFSTNNGGSMAIAVAPSGQVKGYIWTGTSFQ
jgi:prepilin-type N-terminal cleavage/methylation domain-containing protein